MKKVRINWDPRKDRDRRITPWNRFRGCLLGMAIGNALGAPVSFLTLGEILSRYGPGGIRSFEGWSRFQAGSFTDHTQLALSTAAGLMNAFKQWRKEGFSDPIDHIYAQYAGWLETQTDPCESRHPSKTCLKALSLNIMGTIESPLNESRGCNGVARAAPVGLAYSTMPDEAFRVGAEAAAITHGHPTLYWSAGAFAMIIAEIAAGEAIKPAAIKAITALDIIPDAEASAYILRKAVVYSEKYIGHAGIARLGDGKSGEEALAAALYASLRFPNNFMSGILLAINNDGDSACIGSIAGAILGTSLGIQGVTLNWPHGVERRDDILGVADDLYKAFIGTHAAQSDI